MMLIWFSVYFHVSSYSLFSTPHSMSFNWVKTEAINRKNMSNTWSPCNVYIAQIHVGQKKAVHWSQQGEYDTCFILESREDTDERRGWRKNKERHVRAACCKHENMYQTFQVCLKVDCEENQPSWRTLTRDLGQGQKQNPKPDNLTTLVQN